MVADDFEDQQSEESASDEFSGVDDDDVQDFSEESGYWGDEDLDEDGQDGVLPADDDDENFEEDSEDGDDGLLPSDDDEDEDGNDSLLPADDDSDDGEDSGILPDDSADISDSLVSDGTESVDGEAEDEFDSDVAAPKMGAVSEEGGIQGAGDSNAALNSSDSIEAAIHEMSGGFEIHSGMVYIPGDVVLLEYVKNSRKETHMGLTQSIKEEGQLQPITVVETAAYAKFKETNPEGVFTGRKYILVDGLRRMYSMVALRYEQAQANILTFEHPEKAASVIPLLRCLYNKAERMSWPELWGYLRVLDESYTLAPNIEEYLLGLDGGDIMKLKDIMANQDKYPDIVDNLFSKKKTLDQSYSALNKARKEEDKLRMEDQSGISSIEEAKDIMEDDQGGQQGDKLSEDDVRDILEMASDSLSDDDFAGKDAGFDMAMTKEDYGAQDVHARHPLDPAVKQAVFRRDNFTCCVCGLSGTPFLSALVVHHIRPVLANGGDNFASPVFIERENGDLGLNPDNNLITLCETDHITAHAIQFQLGGKIPMTREEYEGYSEEKKEHVRRLKLLVDVLVRCDKALKKNRKAKLPMIQHDKPWDSNEVAGDAVLAYNSRQQGDVEPMVGKLVEEAGDSDEE